MRLAMQERMDTKTMFESPGKRSHPAAKCSLFAMMAAVGASFLWAMSQEGELSLGAGEQIGNTSSNFSSRVNAVSLASDGRSLGVARTDGLLELWKLPEAERVRSLFDPSKEQLQERFGSQFTVESLVFLPDGKRIAGAGFGFGLRLLDVETGKTLWHEPNATGSLALSQDGKSILAGVDYQGGLAIRDTSTGKEAAHLKGHQQSINSAAFSPDGKAVYSASRDLTVRKWDIATGRELWRVGEASAERSIGPTFPHCVALSPDGRWLAVSFHGCWDIGLQILDASSGKVVSTTGIGHSDAIIFLGKSNLLALQGKEDRICVWDADRKTMKARSSGIHKGRVFAMASHPDGSRLITAGDDGRILLWDTSKLR